MKVILLIKYWLSLDFFYQIFILEEGVDTTQ